MPCSKPSMFTQHPPRGWCLNPKGGCLVAPVKSIHLATPGRVNGRKIRSFFGKLGYKTSPKPSLVLIWCCWTKFHGRRRVNRSSNVPFLKKNKVWVMRKKKLLLSIESWLFNRDPYKGYIIIPTSLGRISSPIYLKQPGFRFILVAKQVAISRFGLTSRMASPSTRTTGPRTTSPHNTPRFEAIMGWNRVKSHPVFSHL